jgi:hypothetical protein
MEASSSRQKPTMAAAAWPSATLPGASWTNAADDDVARLLVRRADHDHVVDVGMGEDPVLHLDWVDVDPTRTG